MRTFLSVPGALYSDGTIPLKDQAAARVTLEMTLEETKFMERILCIAEGDALLVADQRAIRDLRRQLKLSYR